MAPKNAKKNVLASFALPEAAGAGAAGAPDMQRGGAPKTGPQKRELSSESLVTPTRRVRCKTKNDDVECASSSSTPTCCSVPKKAKDRCALDRLNGVVSDSLVNNLLETIGDMDCASGSAGDTQATAEDNPPPPLAGPNMSQRSDARVHAWLGQGLHVGLCKVRAALICTMNMHLS